MAFTAKLPTSKSGAVGFVKRTGGTAVWIVGGLLALGVVVSILPFLKRVPVLGGLLGRGQQMLPGQQSMQVDQWGRVR